MNKKIFMITLFIIQLISYAESMPETDRGSIVADYCVVLSDTASYVLLQEQHRDTPLMAPAFFDSLFPNHKKDGYIECKQLGQSRFFSTEFIFDEKRCWALNSGVWGSISCGVIRISDTPQLDEPSSRLVDDFRAPIPVSADFFMCFTSCGVCSHRVDDSEDCERRQDNQLIRSKFGQIIPLEWKWKSKCKPYFDTTFTGTYPVRITGECSDSMVSQKTNEEQENEGHP
jgi:hypothetical protein